MRSMRRNQLLLFAAVLLAAVPVTFGLTRAVTTGNDLRYLWLAAAAILGSMAAMRFTRGKADPARVPLGRALCAVAAGALSAAATAILLGAKAGPGVAIVALGFGLCTGASALFAGLARRPPTL